MDKRKRAKFQAILEAKHKTLFDKFTRTKKAGFTDSNDGTHDAGDMASRTYEREFLLTLSDNERDVLFKIERALKRVQSTKYGSCTLCKKTIQATRLEAIPWATQCIECAKSIEADQNIQH